MYGIERDSPEFREMVNHRAWCPTDYRTRRVRTPSRGDSRGGVLALSMEVGREDGGFHARIGAPLVGREERSDVVQRVDSARGGWDNRIFDFFSLLWDIRGGV